MSGKTSWGQAKKLTIANENDTHKSFSVFPNITLQHVQNSMPRIARMLFEDQPTVYHVMSRTALDGLPFGDIEKDMMLSYIKRFTSIYFSDVLGFCIMGNHFHILIRMHPSSSISDDDVKARFQYVYGDTVVADTRSIARLKQKWCSLSELLREIKQTSSRFYNAKHNRRGYLWGDRFKSVVVENGHALLNCLAYIDLNPIRAGIVDQPEAYRWSSIGYRMQTNNAGDYLSDDFGIEEWSNSPRLLMRQYRQFLYETGAIDRGTGKSIRKKVLHDAQQNNFEYTQANRFLFRSKWFTESGIIGSKHFVEKLLNQLSLPAKNKRSPHEIPGFDFFSFKRFREQS